MKYILILGFILVGAFNIRNAIRSFTHGYYFISGINIMLAIWMAAGMVEVVLRYPV